MVHPDHETRVVAHRIFSVVLVPSSICPQPSSAAPELKTIEFPRTLSRTVSVFSSSAALFEKLKNQRNSSRENLNELNNQKSVDEEEQLNNNSGMLNRIKSTFSQVNSFRNSPASDVDSVTKSSKDMVSFWFLFTVIEVHSFRLLHKCALLLSYWSFFYPYPAFIKQQ